MKRAFTDDEMLAAIRAGGTGLDDVMSFIYYRSGYRDSIMAYIRKRNGSTADAEDVFQDGISQLIMNIRKGKFEGRSSLRTYLTTICKNLWYSKFSRSVKHTDIVEQLEPGDEVAASPEALFVHRERSQNLEAILGELGEKCKRVLSLWSLSYAMQEIADALGYQSEGMARKKKHQCFQKLMALVKDQPHLVRELIGKL